MLRFVSAWYGNTVICDGYGTVGFGLFWHGAIRQVPVRYDLVRKSKTWAIFQPPKLFFYSL
jgi:hypothetical protein